MLDARIKRWMYKDEGGKRVMFYADVFSPKKQNLSYDWFLKEQRRVPKDSVKHLASWRSSFPKGD